MLLEADHFPLSEGTAWGFLLKFISSHFKQETIGSIHLTVWVCCMQGYVSKLRMFVHKLEEKVPMLKSPATNHCSIVHVSDVFKFQRRWLRQKPLVTACPLFLWWFVSQAFPYRCTVSEIVNRVQYQRPKCHLYSGLKADYLSRSSLCWDQWSWRPSKFF